MKILAKQSVMEKAVSFTMHLAVLNEKRTLGIADGKYAIPDDIDELRSSLPGANGRMKRWMSKPAIQRAVLFRQDKERRFYAIYMGRY